MQNTPLNQIAAMPKGNIVPAISGKIKSVFDSRSGNGQYGPYKIQTLMIEDGGVSVGLVIKDRDDIAKATVGQMVTVQCVTGSRGDLVGIKVSVHSQKQINELTVSPDAIINIGGAAPQSAQQQPPAQSGAPAQSRYGAPANQQAQAHQAPPRNAPGPEEVSSLLEKEGNLMSLCVRTANRVADIAYQESNEKLNFSEESVRSTAIALYITARRENWQAGL